MYAFARNTTSIGEAAGYQRRNHNAVQAVVAVVAEQHRVPGFQVNDFAEFMFANVDDLLPGDAADAIAIDLGFDANRFQAIDVANQPMQQFRLVDQFLDFDALSRRCQ